MAVIIKQLIALLIVSFGITQNVHARRANSPLLIEEDGSRRNRPAECQFGKQLKELGSTWFADLGPPFGVMYCIKCECVPLQRKRRIVARVQCRNIKNECPITTCDEPILLPGRCCKTCPGDLYSPDIVQDIPQLVTNEEEERNMKHFAALLTGRTSDLLTRDEMKSVYSTNNPQNIVATGRFSFHKKNLYYSFYISEKASRPRSIQFVDHVGRILEEHSLVLPSNGPLSTYQNSTGKICGVWRRVPRDYRRLLRDDQMNVVLLWGGKYQAELALAGQIGKYTALSTELFSSLLEPAAGTNTELMSGAGGTAIVSTSSGFTSSIHITLVLNGLFGADEISDVPLNIRLESVEKKQIILEDFKRVKKPAFAVNVLEFSSPVSTNDLRMLSRGRLMITVENRANPEMLRIQGNVITRVACEVFQTLLASHNSDSITRSSGLAWLYLNRDGSLVYNIHTNNLNQQDHPSIVLIDDSGKRKTELEDLTSSLVVDSAVGTLERLGPRVLEPLYSGDLAINVATPMDTTLIRGRFVARPVADSRDSNAPVLLKRIDTSKPAHLVGMAWIAVDNDCNLHYEVTLTGLSSHYQPLELYWEELPIEAVKAPISRRLLEEFTGNYLEGFALGISSHELAKLESSVSYLEVRSKDRNEALLRAQLKSTKIPSQCYPAYTDNDVPNVSYIPTEHNDNNVPMAEKKCYHSGRFYDDGEFWHSSLDACTMCSCGHGAIKCDAIKCPTLKCKKDDIITKKGDCCPSCMNAKAVSDNYNSSVARGCKLGDQFYVAGKSWHPYLPPNGFDTCTVCTCNSITLDVQCPRTQCPPLNCPEKLAYRPDKKACCKKCPDDKPGQQLESSTKCNDTMVCDQSSKKGTLRSPQTILENGGCKTAMGVYENGLEWHPVIASHGEQKCIKCRCKDGNITCERKRCTKAVCSNRIPGRKYPELDECCRCRSRRHQHSNSEHRRKNQQQNQQQQQQNSGAPRRQSTALTTNKS